MIKENNRKQKNSEQFNKKLAKYIDKEYKVFQGDEEPPIYMQNLVIIASNIPSTFEFLKYKDYENVELLLKSRYFEAKYWFAVYGADKLKD